MFEDLFERPHTIEKYRSVPLYKDRLKYLIHMADGGAAPRTLYKIAYCQLTLVGLLDLQEGETVTLSRLTAVAEARFDRDQHPGGQRSRASSEFLGCALRWLRFLDRVEEPAELRHPYAVEIEAFTVWMRDERGLSEGTICSRRQAAADFLKRLAVRNITLAAAEMADVDEFLATKMASGSYKRATIYNYARYLRTFLGFGEDRGHCRPGLAEGVLPSRIYQDDTIPTGLSRDGVRRLLASTEGERPLDKRDRAILMLLIGYGLRAGEVCGLQLDDLDWEQETIRVHRSKLGRSDLYPLSHGVGQAILRYLVEVRPRWPERSLFLTFRAPTRPLRTSALSEIVGRRLDRLGLNVRRRGAHVLRHSAAQHLLDHGLPMKTIGDYLGHRRIASTSVYAKIHLEALREVVADFDLEGLA
ncbi:MAG: site-specific integrase [Alphaproteobacteria bacterium]|nr:site-specific integrase [Alphaproteobacteria bacterium]